MNKNKNLKVFDDYSNYYDLLYKDKDYLGEASYINNLLKKFSLIKCNILEFGSGTGGHASVLTQKFGHNILGVDFSEKMVSMATNNETFNSVVGDMRYYDANKKFDCVLALFHVVSYLPTSRDIDLFFKNANKHLNRGGKLIFDTWYTPCVRFIGPTNTIKKMENSVCEIIRFGEPRTIKSNNQVEVNFTTFVRNKPDSSWNKLYETHLMRHFDDKDIEIMSKKNGFKLIASEEFLSGKKASKKTWGVCYVLEKE
tara:strand:+ start:1705 stop:2469 length:765 start_codon:yes stop_codon:yes gene_type:complete